jgi:hypothetical protein
MYDIYVVKLINGTDVITQVPDMTDKSITLEQPMVPIPVQGGMVLSKWSPFSEDTYFAIDMDRVMSVTKCESSTAAHYTKVVLTTLSIETLTPEEQHLLEENHTSYVDGPTTVQ